jgi:hypothetical protein
MLPPGTTVTFDTNTLDKAARPERNPKDPSQVDFKKVHEALRSGILRGFVSETIVTLEGIQRSDRAQVFASTRIATAGTEPQVNADGTVTRLLNLQAIQPSRQPLHEENVRRLTAALQLGFRVLSATRLLMPKIDDPNKEIYLYGVADDSTLAARFNDAADAIEARGFGSVPIMKIAAGLANRAGVGAEPWYRSLNRANAAEEGKIASAFAEWADGDTVAAHITFQIQYLCTDDRAAKAKLSIFDPIQRAWLMATFGVRFVTISELAAMVE